MHDTAAWCRESLACPPHACASPLRQHACASGAGTCHNQACAANRVQLQQHTGQRASSCMVASAVYAVSILLHDCGPRLHLAWPASCHDIKARQRSRQQRGMSQLDHCYGKADRQSCCCLAHDNSSAKQRPAPMLAFDIGVLWGSGAGGLK